MKSAWKEASTLILTALKKPPVTTNWNYTLLTLKRSSQSSFMPSGHVFPGGATETTDGDKAWLDFLSNFGVNLNEVTKITGKVPPILENEGQLIPKLLSLKIAAIRETFEETGILLCTCQNQPERLKWGSFGTFEGLDSWRSKVQKNPVEFLNMCKSYNCCPDVSALHLWSNWLTPTSKGSKRFDTAFFVATLKETPVAVADKTEVEKLNWAAPDTLIRSSKAQEIWLPPPQFYEISRLLQFKDIKDLNEFAVKRSASGCERWMPVQLNTSSGMVSLLPGDGLYGEPDYVTPSKREEIVMSSEEFRSQSEVLHRMEFVGPVETKIVLKNYNPTCEHVLPVEDL